jgi:hypothetical protein
VSRPKAKLTACWWCCRRSLPERVDVAGFRVLTHPMAAPGEGPAANRRSWARRTAARLITLGPGSA